MVETFGGLVGRFVELDGIDGVGKTTQADLLQLFLKEIGKKSRIVKEVDKYDDFSSSIRDILFKGNLDPETEMFLFLSLKSHCFKRNVIEALESDDIIIFDRGVPSFLTYNYNILKGSSLGIDLMEFIYSGYKPLISIILDAPFDEIKRRIESKEKKSRFDADLSHLMQQQQLLKNMAKDYPKWTVVDAGGDIASVHQNIKRVILDVL